MRRKWRRAKPKPIKPIFKANTQIRSPKVFLIDEQGEKVGEIETEKAIKRAKDLELDLVEVNPKANPPIVKIADLGQLKYEHDKKVHKQRLQQKKIEIKSLRLSMRISKHDFDFRIDQAIKFLKKGNKLKLELNLRGRERQHLNKAKEVLVAFVKKLKENEDLDIIEEQALTKQGGRFTMILLNKSQ